MESNYRNPGPPMGYNVPPQGAAAAPPVRIGEWIGEGWRMFTEQWKGWVTLALGLFAGVVVPMVIVMIIAYAAILGSAIEQASRPSSSAPGVPPGIFLFYLAIFGMALVLMPLTVFLLGGMYRAAFKQLRGGQVEFKDLFSAKDCYVRLLVAAVIMYFAVMIGSMLCIVPGLLAAGLLFFTLPLIVERNMGVMDAIKLSYETTKPNMLMWAVFAFVVQLIVSAGSAACYVGLLATYPLLFTIHAVAFRDCFGVQGARSFNVQQIPPSSIYAPPQQQQPMSQYPPMSQQPSAPPPPPAPPQYQQQQYPQSQQYQPPPQYPQPPAQQQPPAPQAPPVAQSQPAATATLCPNCHSKVPATAVFCPKCGTGVRKP